MSGPEALAAYAAEGRAAVSVHLGGLDGSSAFELEADREHPAASTFKVALVEALFGSGLDVEDQIEVRAELPSVVGGTFETTEDYDNDPAVWERLGGTASLGWLAERAIVRSSNLATNLLLDRLGLDAVNAVYAGNGCRVERPIQDDAAGEAGRANVVTARGLSDVLGRLHPGTEPLMARCEDAGMAPGLPPGTRLAHKPGWFEGVCHDHGIVRAPGEDPRVLSVLTGADLDERAHLQLLADVTARAWEHR